MFFYEHLGYLSLFIFPLPRYREKSMYTYILTLVQRHIKGKILTGKLLCKKCNYSFNLQT